MSLQKLIKTVLAIVMAIGFMPGLVRAEIITTDTIIDASSPFNGSNITVRDGDDGPTTVRIVEGGSVAGFTVQGSSHLILDGGESTLLSGPAENARLTILSGTIDCTDSICAVLDYDAELTANDDSQIFFRGNALTGVVRLNDRSSAHFFGRGLTVGQSSQGSFTRVQGEYVNGEDFGVGFHPFSGEQNVVLHEVPEPSVFILLMQGFCFAMHRLRCRGRE